MRRSRASVPSVHCRLLCAAALCRGVSGLACQAQLPVLRGGSLPEALALADRVLFLSTGPSSVILDYAIKTPRSGDLTSAVVMALQQELLSQHPLLLQGAMGLGVGPAN